MHLPPILPVGTAVVVLSGRDHPTHPKGSVGTIVHAPLDPQYSYRVRFPGGEEASFGRTQIEVLSHWQASMATGEGGALTASDLGAQIVLRVVVGSRAFGLDHDASDTDRRGVYLPSAERHWSLWGVPEQIEDDRNQECYWEIAKFLSLALKANPNVLEVLHSPWVEHADPIGLGLLEIRGIFVSRLVFATFNGYAQSQFKKMEQDLRNHGQIKWKHAMHLLRLLLSGIETLDTGKVPVQVAFQHRDRLLAIRAGAESWESIEGWRRELHNRFEAAYAVTRIPDRPDYAVANEFLLRARRHAAGLETFA